MAKLYVRQCKRDGVVWEVPSHLTVPPNGLLMFAAKQVAGGEQMYGGGIGRGANVDRARLEQNKIEATRLQHCPHCGHKDWKQGRSKVMPLSLEQQREQLGLNSVPPYAPPPRALPPPPPPPPPRSVAPPPPEPTKLFATSGIVGGGTITVSRDQLEHLVASMVDREMAKRGWIADPMR